EILVLVWSAHSVEIRRGTHDGDAVIVPERREHEPSCRRDRTLFGSSGAVRQGLANRWDLVPIYLRSTRKTDARSIPQFRLRIEQRARGVWGGGGGRKNEAEQESAEQRANKQCLFLKHTRVPPGSPVQSSIGPSAANRR